MKLRFKLYRRKLGGTFYVQDNETNKQESLNTKDRAEAVILLNARNEAARQPQLIFRSPRLIWREPIREFPPAPGKMRSTPSLTTSGERLGNAGSAVPVKRHLISSGGSSSSRRRRSERRHVATRNGLHKRRSVTTARPFTGPRRASYRWR